MPYTGNAKDCRHPHIFRFLHKKRDLTPGGGGHLSIFWVDMYRPGLQIGTPF